MKELEIDFIGVTECQQYQQALQNRCKNDSPISLVKIKGIGFKAGQVIGTVDVLCREIFAQSREITKRKTVKREQSKRRMLCAMLEVLSFHEERHRLVAQICSFGIAISNGAFTTHLVECFGIYDKDVTQLSDYKKRLIRSSSIKINRMNNTDFSALYHV